MWMATLKTLCFVVCVGNINRMEAMVVKRGLMWVINYCVKIKSNPIKSDQHKYSVTLDLAHGVDDMASNINTSAMIAVKDALEVLFFMLQHNLALDLFSSLIDVDLPKLRLAKNATYSSWDTVHDLLNILSKHVKQILLTNMNNSPCYATMVEEVTDNRTIKHLAICTRFFNQKGVVQNGFLTDIELPNATANSITSAITT